MAATQPTLLEAPKDQVIDLSREESLEQLLGVDYEFARESGLLDQFYYDPEKGNDAVLHILSGTRGDQQDFAGGFHHEPSALHPDTYVDREHLETADTKTVRMYEKIPYNPYPAHVVVANEKKLGLVKDGTLADAHNSMFPAEYDALTVLRQIVRSRDERDISKDKQKDDVIVTEGKVAMLDGKTLLRMRLILSRTDQRIISAYPIIRRSRMNLSRSEARKHLGIE